MEEQSNDSIPVAVGGVCSECGEPCCLQPSCSVIREKDGFPMNSAMTVKKAVLHKAFLLVRLRGRLFRKRDLEVTPSVDYVEQGTLIFMKETVEVVGFS